MSLNKKLLYIALAILVGVQNCFAAYNEISRYRPLKADERDFKNPLDFDIGPSLTLYISSGFRPKYPPSDAFVVSIRTRQPTAYFGDNHFCSGTIITTRIIITAAHCVVDGQSIVTRPARLRVIAGSSYRLTKESTTIEFKVEKVIPHLHFKRNKGNDIALLLLADAIPKTNIRIKILSVALETPEVGTNCHTLGWGQLYTDGPYADRIMYGNLSILPDSKCVEAYGYRFTKDKLCTGNEGDPYERTCRGDSGAPLICNGKLAGIVAFSRECQTLKPTVFTNVAKFTKWVFDANDGQQININSYLWFIMFSIYYTVQ